MRKRRVALWFVGVVVMATIFLGVHIVVSDVQRVFAQEDGSADKGGSVLPIGTVVAWDPFERDTAGSPLRDPDTNRAHLRVLSPDWRICDGTDGTPNLANRFVYGSGAKHAGWDDQENYGDVWWADGKPKVQGAVNVDFWVIGVQSSGVGGNINHAHGIPHQHSGRTDTARGDNRDRGDKGSADHHDHGFTTNPVPDLASNLTSVLPPYVTLVYIIKVR